MMSDNVKDENQARTSTSIDPTIMHQKESRGTNLPLPVRYRVWRGREREPRRTISGKRERRAWSSVSLGSCEVRVG